MDFASLSTDTLSPELLLSLLLFKCCLTTCFFNLQGPIVERALFKEANILPSNPPPELLLPVILHKSLTFSDPQFAHLQMISEGHNQANISFNYSWVCLSKTLPYRQREPLKVKFGMLPSLASLCFGSFQLVQIQSKLSGDTGKLTEKTATEDLKTTINNLTCSK